MDSLNENPLTQHVEGIARELRWWRLVGVAALAILGLGMLAGATRERVPEEIRVLPLS